MQFLDHALKTQAALGKVNRGVDAAATALVKVLKDDGKIIACGNGGSATQAMHFTEELVGKYCKPRDPIPALCLNSDVGAITCIANDFGYGQIFRRQIEALACSNDALILLSTSGNSPNIVNAANDWTDKHSSFGGPLIVLTGRNMNSKVAHFADHLITVDSDDTSVIQEVHLSILHYFVEVIESNFENIFE